MFVVVCLFLFCFVWSIIYMHTFSKNRSWNLTFVPFLSSQSNRNESINTNNVFSCSSNSDNATNATASFTSDGQTFNTTDIPVNDAEMKALMSMFVEIMGMSVDGNGNGSGSSGNDNSGETGKTKSKSKGSSSSDHTHTNSHTQSNKSKSRSKSPNETIEMGIGPGQTMRVNVNAATALLDRMNKVGGFQGLKEAMEQNQQQQSQHHNQQKQKDSSSGSRDEERSPQRKKRNSSGNYTGDSNVSSNDGNGKSTNAGGGGGASPFPVFSMMFGGGNNSSSSKSKSKSTSSKADSNKVIPPPPGGWPPGAAAAAAAAVASANAAGSSASNSKSPTVAWDVNANVPYDFDVTSMDMDMDMDDIIAVGNAIRRSNEREEEMSSGRDKEREGSYDTDEYSDAAWDVNDIALGKEFENAIYELDRMQQEEDNDDDDESGDEGEELDDDDDCSIPELLPVSEPFVQLPPKRRSRSKPTKKQIDDFLISKGFDLSGKKNNSNKNNTATETETSESGSVYRESQSDINNSQIEDPSIRAAEELLREEEEARAARDEDEEKAKRAAKKREKKQRKKERARREAAIKTAETSIKKRDKAIVSWRSRMVTAFTSGEVKKVESLIIENPFKDGKQLHFDEDIIEYLEDQLISHEDEINENMSWLLNSCVVKNTSNGKGTNWLDARNRLCQFIVEMAFHVVFELKRDSKSALHHACFSGDISFVKIVVEHHEVRQKDSKLGKVKEDCLIKTCEYLGWNPLHYAAVGGWNDIVEFLLVTGCNVNLRTNPSFTCRAR